MNEIKFFFLKKKLKLKQIFPNIKLSDDFIINDIKPLHSANRNDITFFDALKYKNDAYKTKSRICITTKKLETHLPKTTLKIIVDNVLLELASILKKIYPSADIDYPDDTLKSPSKKITNLLNLVIMF